MRSKALLIACALLLGLMGVTSEAQDLIRYYPPSGVSTAITTPGFSYASNVGSLVNGATAQTFHIYSTYTDASNYERGVLKFTGGSFTMATEKAGSGSNRDNYFAPSSGNNTFGGQILPDSDDSRYMGIPGQAWSRLYLLRGIQGSKSKTLVDAAAAVSFVRVAVATNASAGGTVIWNAMSTDGTSPLTQVGMTYFAGVNTAGTVTCTVGAVGTPITAYSRVNTLACTVSAVTSTTNCDLQVTCTDNLAGDQTPVFNWRLDMPVPNIVTPQ